MSALPLVLLTGLCGQFADPGTTPERPAPYQITAETPLERFDAAGRMIRIGRPDVARRLLAELLERQPRRNELIELRDLYGSGTLLALARNDDVQPEGRLLFDAVAAAIAADDADPASVDRLLAALAAGGETADRAAIEARRRGRPLAIDLFNRIDNSDPVTVAAIAKGLQAIGEAGLDPALAVVDVASRQPFVMATLRGVQRTDRIDDLIILEADPTYAGTGLPAAASEVLNRQSVPLKRVDPTRTLQQAAIELLRGERQPRDPASRLRFDAEADQLVASPMSSSEARLVDAARYAAAAARINPADRDAAALSELLRLESDPAAASDPVAALAAAVDLNLPGLAVAAIGRIDSQSAVTDGGPLVDAMDHPNRGVQLAAAVRVAALDPETPFAGSHRATEILVANLAAGSEPRVVVIDPNTVRGNATGGQFAALGFRPEVAKTGREGVAAAASPDVQLVVVDPNAIRNPLSTTLAELAADVRTREVPVIILTGPGLIAKAEIATRNHPRAIVALATEDDDYLRRQVAEALPRPADRVADRSERAANALAAIAARDQTGFVLEPFADDIVAGLTRQTNLDPVIAGDILSAVGTRDARRLLLALAAASDDAAALRRAARRQAERFPTFRRTN